MNYGKGKLDLNDPNISAFALGELDSAAMAEWEKRIALDPEAQKLVAEIRATAKMLSQEFSKESLPELNRAERERLEPRLLRTKNKSLSWNERFAAALRWQLFVPAVAVGVLCLLLIPEQLRQLREEIEPVKDMVSNEIDVVPAQPTTVAPGVPSEPSSEPAAEPTQVVTGPAEPPQKDMSDSTVEPQTTAMTEEAPNFPREFSRGAKINEGLAMAPAHKGKVDHSGLFGLSGGTSSKKMGVVGRVYGLPSEPSRDSFKNYIENKFIAVKSEPLSTFSSDVDTASYAIVRNFLMSQKQMPPTDAVRIEEMINYFDYNYPKPSGQHPFSVHMEVASAPWNSEHQLLRVALRGKDLERKQNANLVFLIDVSGSMDDENKLPLLRQSLKLLVKDLGREDRVAIVVYAGSSGLVLPSTPASEREKIEKAIDNLSAGGSTNGGEGIALAYQVAQENFIKNGVNRVLLATDGDFNVGVVHEGELTRLIEEKAKTGVFLTVLGFGQGNYNDATMQVLANKGNGNYAFIDSLKEGKKVLVKQAAGTLYTIAKDVKLQIEFNPNHVGAYRLIGYEKRILNKEDFNDDKKDAGEIGAGHTVTAFYELIPAKIYETRPKVDPLKYQPSAGKDSAPAVESNSAPVSGEASAEMLTLKLRYKQPTGDASRLITVPLKQQNQRFDQASSDFKFAASVAGFGMLLKNSEFKGTLTYQKVLETARSNRGGGFLKSSDSRDEFIKIVEEARRLSDQAPRQRNKMRGN